MLEELSWQAAVGAFVFGSAVSLALVLLLTRIRAQDVERPTVPLQQFVLRPEAGEWLKLRREQYAEALQPDGDARPAEGWGDHRIRVNGVDVAFIREGEGLEISFEGAIAVDAAKRIVEEICERIRSVTGQRLQVEAT